MGETLAAPISGGVHAHQPGIHPVLHIAFQDAVLDQHRPLCRCALIIEGQRAPARINRAVIDHGDALGGDLLPHPPGKRRAAFAVEIAFQTVADGFM